MAGDENKAVREAVAGFLEGLRQAGPGDWRDYAIPIAGRPAIPQFQSMRTGDEDAVRGWKVLRVPKVKGLAADERAVDVRLMASGTSTMRIAWIEGSLCVKRVPTIDGEKVVDGWKVQPGTWMPLPAERRWEKG